ncbi:hypothetical protein QTP88_026097 [Uroleucon formosanum]
MPKQITRVLVKKYITEFGSDVFSADQKVLFCNFCETKVSVDKRFIVTQHLKTEKHKRAAKRIENRPGTSKILIQQFITDTTKKSIFSHDLCEALMSANIPLNKLSNPYFKEFLLKYTGKDILSESTLQKGYVDEIYETNYYFEHFEQIKLIINYFDDNNDAVSIKSSKKYLLDHNIEAQLVFIKSNFGFLPDLITRLEKQEIPLIDSTSIVEEAKEKLIKINGEMGKIIKIKIESV